MTASSLIARSGANIWAATCGLFFLIMVAVALRSQQMLFADGSFIAYTPFLHDPWSLLWANYPARAGAALVTVAPAFVLHRAFNLDALTTSFIYQATFLLVPVMFLSLAWRWLAQERRDLLILMIAFSFGIGVTTFCFPTETWVMLAVFWPLWVAFRFPRAGIARWLAVFGLSVIFCFCHEFMILAVPVLGAAAWLGRRQADPLTRRWLAAGVAGLIAAALAAVVIGATAHHPNPLISRALAENSSVVVGSFLRAAFHKPLMVALLMLSALAAYVAGVGLAVAALPAILGIALMLQVVSEGGDIVNPVMSYCARIWVGATLPLAGLFLLGAGSFRRPVRSWPVAALLTLIILDHLYYQAVFVDAWGRFRQALAVSIANGPPALNFDDSPAAQLDKGGDVAGRFLWTWVLPYQSMMLHLPGTQQRASVLQNSSWFVPFTCRDSASLDRPSYVAPEAFRSVVADICAKNGV